MQRHQQGAHQVTELPYKACNCVTVPWSRWSKWLCEMHTKSSLGRTDVSSFGAGTTRLRMLPLLEPPAEHTCRLSCARSWPALHLGPIHCTGEHRSEKTGSVRNVTPSICTRTLAWPSQAAWMLSPVQPASGVASCTSVICHVTEDTCKYFDGEDRYLVGCLVLLGLAGGPERLPGSLPCRPAARRWTACPRASDPAASSGRLSSLAPAGHVPFLYTNPSVALKTRSP